MDAQYNHVPFGDVGKISVRFTEATPMNARRFDDIQLTQAEADRIERSRSDGAGHGYR